MVERNSALETDRRAFLKGAGKYAVAVPPAMTFLLSTTLHSTAVAQSASATPSVAGNTQGAASTSTTASLNASSAASGSGGGSDASGAALAGLAAVGVVAETVCTEVLGECL